MLALLPYIQRYIGAPLWNMLPIIFPNLTLQPDRVSYQSICLSKYADKKNSLSILVPGSENHPYNGLNI